jgi:hypothetical protein
MDRMTSHNLSSCLYLGKIQVVYHRNEESINEQSRGRESLVTSVTRELKAGIKTQKLHKLRGRASHSLATPLHNQYYTNKHYGPNDRGTPKGRVERKAGPSIPHADD